MRNWHRRVLVSVSLDCVRNTETALANSQRGARGFKPQGLEQLLVAPSVSSGLRYQIYHSVRGSMSLCPQVHTKTSGFPTDSQGSRGHFALPYSRIDASIALLLSVGTYVILQHRAEHLTL